MQPKIKDGNSTQSLRWLLQNDQVATWETIYLSGPYESRIGVRPSDLPKIYTHKLIFQKLRQSKKQVDKLVAVLPNCRFVPAKGAGEIRLGMRFYNYSGKVVFEFFTSYWFTDGFVNGQCVTFEGAFSTYLKGLVAQYFEG